MAVEGSSGEWREKARRDNSAKEVRRTLVLRRIGMELCVKFG